MVTIHKSKKETLKQELELNQKVLKPKLRKFLVDYQVKQAKDHATKENKERKKLSSSQEIIDRATQLSQKALLDLKLWKTIAPVLDMPWTRQGTTTPAMIKDMNTDISGFAYYLTREYRNYLLLKRMAHGYRNPMDETNLEYFWLKCQQDLRLLLEADRRRKAKGNSGIILLDKPN